MRQDKYAAVSDQEHETYEFLSSGPKGAIKKVVQYQPLGNNIFNLAFGDWDKEAQEIKDGVRTNNEDRDKVLVTVASTVADFMQYHPDAMIFAEGISPAKTRLYQMGINSNWHEISQLFKVEGFTDGNWEPFKQEKNYKAFVLKPK